MDNNKPIKLLNKNFILLWQGQLVSWIGNNAFNIALVLWLKHRTDSASLVGLIMMCTMLPGVITAPLCGVLADRLSRWKIIVFSDLFQGILVLGFAALLYVFSDTGPGIIVLLAIIAVLKSLVGAVFNPTISASIPLLVPAKKLHKANSMNSLSSLMAYSLGQGLGGLVFRIVGAPILFLIDGVSYIFSAISEMFIKIPQDFKINNNAKGKIPETMRDIKEGLVFIINNRGMLYLFLGLALLFFFLSLLSVLLPFFLEDFLKTTTDWYGYIIGGYHAGQIVGTVLSGINIGGHVRSRLMISSMMIVAATWIVIGIVMDNKAAFSLMLLAGILVGYMLVNVTTLIQLATPDSMRGRVFSVQGTIIFGLGSLGMGIAGIIVDLFNRNIPLIFIVCGLSGVFVFVLLALSRQFRDFLAIETPVLDNMNA